MATPTEFEVRQARAKAVDAQMEADRLEGLARRARRTANSKTKHYEDMLAIYQGQMTIPMEASDE